MFDIVKNNIEKYLIEIGGKEVCNKYIGYEFTRNDGKIIFINYKVYSNRVRISENFKKMIKAMIEE